MAEFCLQCFNKLNRKTLTKKELVLSRGLDLCEGCGEMKQVVVSYRLRYRLQFLGKRWLFPRR